MFLDKGNHQCCLVKHCGLQTIGTGMKNFVQKLKQKKLKNYNYFGVGFTTESFSSWANTYWILTKGV